MNEMKTQVPLNHKSQTKLGIFAKNDIEMLKQEGYTFSNLT